MTTTLLIVVIILIWNLAVLYLPFDKKQKAKLSLISIAILVIYPFVPKSHEGIDEDTQMRINLCHSIEWYQRMDHPEKAKAMMATFNITEEELAQSIDKNTPIESMVIGFLSLTLMLTPVLLYIVVIDRDDKEKKVKMVLFFLNIVASGLFLSLYFGLKLPLLPWIHKKLEKEKSLPVLLKRELA